LNQPFTNRGTVADIFISYARADRERDEALAAISLEDYRLNLKRWFYPQPELLKRLEGDLRTAGMDFL
jgi:hypothetical protein